MKRTAEARWEKATTMERLDEMGFATQGAVLRFDDKVLVVGRECWGFHAAVYKADPKAYLAETGEFEWHLDLEKACKELFKDGGHAMAWCMERI